MFRSSFVPFLFLDLIIISIFGDIISVGHQAINTSELLSTYVYSTYVSISFRDDTMT